MIFVKDGAAGFLHPHVMKAKGRLGRLFQYYGEDLLITSLCDGFHSWTTLHRGYAFDYKKPKHPKLTYKRCKAALGPGFDLVIEDDHDHAEFDPKIL
jgi:hypothetical protein